MVALGGEAAVCQALLDAAAAGAVVGSGDPITDALAAGTLTEVEALRLRVLRLAGDPAVPDEYLVPDPSVDASLVLKQAADQFTTLPPDVQEELAPHLAPPLYTDSAATAFAQDGTSPTGCLGGSAAPPPAAEGWDAVVTAHATIHWPIGGDVFGSAQVATPEEVERPPTGSARSSRRSTPPRPRCSAFTRCPTPSRPAAAATAPSTST